MANKENANKENNEQQQIIDGATTGNSTIIFYNDGHSQIINHPIGPEEEDSDTNSYPLTTNPTFPLHDPRYFQHPINEKRRHNNDDVDSSRDSSDSDNKGTKDASEPAQVLDGATTGNNTIIFYDNGRNKTITTPITTDVSGREDTSSQDVLTHIITGTKDDDYLKGGNEDNIIHGLRGNDEIHGQNGDDFLYGGRGQDSLYGGNGDDFLYGGRGDDVLYGQNGDDVLYGGRGNDQLWGGYGDDVLYGGRGNDSLNGGNGDDELRGGRGDDTLYGGNSDDALYGGNDNDTLYGQDGNDILRGQGGDDSLYGGNGADRLAGGKGNDRLYGGNGNDRLAGGQGDDMLYGGGGKDTLIGGDGNDKFIVDSGRSMLFISEEARNDFLAADTIKDFSQGDQLIIKSVYEPAVAYPVTDGKSEINDYPASYAVTSIKFVQTENGTEVYLTQGKNTHQVAFMEGVNADELYYTHNAETGDVIITRNELFAILSEETTLDSAIVDYLDSSAQDTAQNAVSSGPALQSLNAPSTFSAPDHNDLVNLELLNNTSVV